MKLLHIADAHLDSKMESKLDKSKASLRRDELLDTFCGIADYADENGVSAVIIAGDLFDTRNVRVGECRLRWETRKCLISRQAEAMPKLRLLYSPWVRTARFCLRLLGGNSQL